MDLRSQDYSGIPRANVGTNGQDVLEFRSCSKLIVGQSCAIGQVGAEWA